MKTALRFAAAVGFLIPFIPGVWLIRSGFSAPTTQDMAIPIAIGAFLAGNAVFVGAVLLFAAENLGDARGGSSAR